MRKFLVAWRIIAIACAIPTCFVRANAQGRVDIYLQTAIDQVNNICLFSKGYQLTATLDGKIQIKDKSGRISIDLDAKELKGNLNYKDETIREKMDLKTMDCMKELMRPIIDYLIDKSKRLEMDKQLRTQVTDLMLPSIDDLELGAPISIVKERKYAGGWRGTGQGSGQDYFYRQTSIAGRAYYMKYNFDFYELFYRIRLSSIDDDGNPSILFPPPGPCDEDFKERNLEYCHVITYLQTIYAPRHGIKFSLPNVKQSYHADRNARCESTVESREMTGIKANRTMTVTSIQETGRFADQNRGAQNCNFAISFEIPPSKPR